MREELSARLKVAKDIKNRLMSLNDKNPDSDQDCMTDFADATEGKYVYGVIMRFTQAKNVPAIPDGFENMDSFKEAQLKVPDALKGKMLCRYVYHIFVTDGYVITDLRKDYTVGRLEKYLNFLLMGTNYDLIPSVMSNVIKMKDIKTIVFKNPMVKREDLKVDLSIKDKAKDLLTQLFPHASNIEDIMERNIISAKMTLSLSKPEDMIEEDYEMQMGAVLKPVGDPELVSLGMVQGLEVKGSDILLSKEMELPDSPSDEEYIKAMKAVVKSLEE
jgi:hypothetical protein